MREKTKESRKRNSLISGVVMILLIVLTFFLLFRDNSPQEILNAIKNANPLYLMLGIAAMLVFIASEAAIIHTSMKTLNSKIKFRRCMEYSFIGFYFSSITPSSTGGQPAQIYYMKKDKISISHSSLILLVITSIYQMVMLFYGIIMFSLRYRVLSEGMAVLKWLFIFGVIANGVSAIFLLFAIFNRKLIERILFFFINLLAKFKIIKNKEVVFDKLGQSLNEYEKGAQYIKEKPVFLIKTIIYTVIQMTAMYLVPFFVYHSFGLTGNSLLDIVAVQAVLSLSVSAVPLPGAVGASESGFMILYKILFSSAFIFPAMLLSRIISFYFILLVSGIVCVCVGIRQNRRKGMFLGVY